jgi:hypothetical protein
VRLRDLGERESLPDLRDEATQSIVPIYQSDISSRSFAVARLTRELR